MRESYSISTYLLILSNHSECVLDCSERHPNLYMMDFSLFLHGETYVLTL